jgi:4,5:9,10-diseco-3-hydroxy-5,9,17-trioxoandrosta-1(10),2-diene-4-oate hydrolase
MPGTAAPRSSFIDAGGVRIHYQEIGSGSPVLFLHGGGPGATGWGNFSRNAPVIAGRHRSIVMDMPQYGGSAKVPINGGLLAFNARVISDFIGALGIDRVSLIGNSMGGGTAAKFAIDYPDRVDRLVLMGASGHGPSAFMPTPNESIRQMIRYYDDPSPGRMRAIIEALVSDPSQVTEELVQARYQSSVDPEIVELQRSNRPPRSEDLATELARIKAPTLLIWGREERFSTLEHALLFLRRIPRADLIILAECGHWVQWERPDEFNRLVLDFLSAPR